MHRVNLLVATALVEVGARLLLLILPSVPVALLLGVDRVALEAIVIARVAGAALLSLGAACWLARKDEQSGATTGLIAAMLVGSRKGDATRMALPEVLTVVVKPG